MILIAFHAREFRHLDVEKYEVNLPVLNTLRAFDRAGSNVYQLQSFRLALRNLPAHSAPAAHRL